MKIIKEYKTNKSVSGIANKDNKIVFFKKDLINTEDEIKGYEFVKKYYNVPKMIEYDKNSITYEYKEELMNKTIHDYLYTNNLVFNYDKVFNQYKNSLKNIVYIDETKYKNNKFYKGRINVLDNYIKNDVLKSSYVIEGKEYKINDIISDVIEKIMQDKKLHGFISQGDPTDTNISIDGTFVDFENAGYNSLVGEIAIAIASFYTHGMYFYPKYHSQAYEIRPNILSKINLYKPNIKNYKKENKIYIEGEFINFNKNKEYLINYLKLFQQSLDESILNEINKYLKYYICMRMLTPINFLNMEYDDQLTIIYYIIKFYYEVNSIEDMLSLINGGYS